MSSARLLCLFITTVSTLIGQHGNIQGQVDTDYIVNSLHQSLGRENREQMKLTHVVKDSVMEDDPLQIIETLHGPVVGMRREEMDQRQGTVAKWTEYKGIPFAEPPIGSKRFLPPSPPLNWSTPIYKADEDLTICPQIILGGLLDRSDEDCLYLHVHVPDQDTSDLLPVMVWIHGGGFMSGDGTPDSFGPQYLVVHGVIVVTINYRLGPLGYLSLGTEEVPGNMGQMDQIMALQWVQNNIEHFGGDKNLVTVFGQSAGACAATYHMFSPQADGLMRRVIAQSGLGGFMPSFHHYQENQATKYGSNAAILLGCLDWDKRAECLREKSVFAIQSLEVPMEIISQPSIDDIHSQTPYLPKNPLDMVKSGQYNTEIDLLLGFNEDDGLLISQFFLQAPDLYNVLVEAWNFLGPFALLQKHHTEIVDVDIEMATEILDFYTAGGGLENLGPGNFWNVTNMFSDSFFYFANYLFLEHHLQYSRANTFQYRFSYFGQYHRVGAPGLDHDNSPGVTHSDELYFFWNPFWEKNYPLNEQDSKMSLKLTTMWTNFAKFGDPTPGDDIEQTKWVAQTPQQKEYLRIDKAGEFKMDLGEDYLERVHFWAGLMTKYNVTLV